MLSRVIRVGAIVFLLGLVATPAFAQQERRGRGGGFGGFGGGGGAFELLNLLSAPEVRKEVQLSDEGYAAVQKQQQENMEAMQGARGRFRPDASQEDQEKARAEMTQRMKEMNEKAQAVLDEVLTPEGYNRLLGLHVQIRGDSAAASELVAKKIGLSDADREKVQEAVNQARREAFQGFQGGGGPGAGAPNPDEIRARMDEMRKKTDEAARAQLTDDQKKALEDLKGAKFEIPESLRRGPGFGGPGFGGPGGPGGGRRGGGRPDRDSNN